jgi:hypothetical protein
MNHSIMRTASTALSLAGGAASQLKDGVRNGVARWVPTAVKAVSAGAQLAVLRDGSRKVAKAVKRNPVATAAVVAAAAGAGVALWLMRRNKQQRGYDEELRASEVKSVRAPRAPASKRTASKKATKTATKVSAAG